MEEGREREVELDCECECEYGGGIVVTRNNVRLSVCLSVEVP